MENDEIRLDRAIEQAASQLALKRDFYKVVSDASNQWRVDFYDIANALSERSARARGVRAGTIPSERPLSPQEQWRAARLQGQKEARERLTRGDLDE